MTSTNQTTNINTRAYTSKISKKATGTTVRGISNDKKAKFYVSK